jgi:hypothetical protein
MSDLVVYSHFNIFGEALIKHFNALPYMDKKDVALEVHNKTVYVYVAEHRPELFAQFKEICSNTAPLIEGDENV